MYNIAIIGNPNTGKSTLFNALTKSNVKTGNWHGVTVDKSFKTILYKNDKITFFDLPGIYSMKAFSSEETITHNFIKNCDKNTKFICVLDANSIKRNLLLVLELIEKEIDFLIYINNYDIFKKNGGYIDIQKLEAILNRKIVIGNAKQEKLDNIVKIIGENINLLSNLKIHNQNLEIKNIKENIKYSNTDIAQKYVTINKIFEHCVKIDKNYCYGKSRLDKLFLNKYLWLLFFLITMLAGMFVIFFLLGPMLSEGLIYLLEKVIQTPVMHFLESIVHADWIISFVNDGLFAPFMSIMSFLFPVGLMYIFLGLIEDSGYMSRLAFMFDDSLHKYGLNGKAVYSLIMGFGCNTTAIMTTRGLPNDNMRKKTAILLPYMNCTAKLPIFSVIAAYILGINNIFVILLLYILGIVIALILSAILEKKLLPSKDNRFLIEFPVIRKPNLLKILKDGLAACRLFIKKVVFVIMCVSVIVWILQNFNFKLAFSPLSEHNILPTISGWLLPVFKPIGIGNTYLISALLIGIVAKELILSSLAITKSAYLTLIGGGIVIGEFASIFNFESAVCFLVFCSLYFPCVSTIAMMKQEIGTKITLIAIFSQLVVAYVVTFIVRLILISHLKAIEIIVLTIILAMGFAGLAYIRKNKCCTGFCRNCPTSCKKTKIK